MVVLFRCYLVQQQKFGGDGVAAIEWARQEALRAPNNCVLLGRQSVLSGDETHGGMSLADQQTIDQRRHLQTRANNNADQSFPIMSCHCHARPFPPTAAGLQCSLIETRRIDGKVRHEIVASLGSVPASPSVADRIAFWRRVYETLAELANRIDAETQGKIISAVHSRIPIMNPR